MRPMIRVGQVNFRNLREPTSIVKENADPGMLTAV